MANASQPVWELGTCPAMTGTQVIDVVAQIKPARAVGTVFTVTADASAGEADANLADNHDKAFGLLVQSTGPDLISETYLGAVPLTADRAITTTVQVFNDGNSPAPGTACAWQTPGWVV